MWSLLKSFLAFALSCSQRLFQIIQKKISKNFKLDRIIFTRDSRTNEAIELLFKQQAENICSSTFFRISRKVELQIRKSQAFATKPLRNFVDWKLERISSACYIIIWLSF